ncbi:MAG: hypothetical protein K2K70_14095 [Lachnospiraceae bacterium]|nr:hypothetical protein [Lachnospiraceae bacterium]
MNLNFMGAFLGFFFGNLIWSLLNAIGYCFFGLLLGYQFGSFDFWGLRVLRENGKLKFRFTNFSIYATCNMKAVNRSFRKTAIWEILVWIMGVAVLIPFWEIAKNPVTVEEFVLFGVPFGMGTLYLYQLIRLAHNMVQMFGKGEKSVLWREHQEALNQLDEGVRPMDLQLQYEKRTPITRSDVNYMQFELLKYYSALDAKKYDKLEKYIEEFWQFIPEVWSVMYTPYYYENLFYLCYIVGDVQWAESIMNTIRDVLIADKDVNGRRVYAYYLYYTGKDKRAALQIAREGLQVADAFDCKGLARMEKELLQELIYRIESE